MAKKTTAPSDSIIDLDAEQVIEDVASGEEPKAAAPQELRAQKFSVWPVAGAALVIGAVAGGWLYRDYLSNYFPSDQTFALTERLARLENNAALLGPQIAKVDKLSIRVATDLDALEAKQALSGTLTETLDSRLNDITLQMNDLAKGLAQTKTTLADIAARAPTPEATNAGELSAVAALQARLTTLEHDVAALKGAADEKLSASTALMQSSAALQAGVGSGAAFQTEFDQFARLLPTAEGLDVLQRYAASGATSAKELAADMRKLIPNLARPAEAEKGPPSDNGDWWDMIVGYASSLITIRTVGDVDWQVVASEAADFAIAGDLPKAIEHIAAQADEAPKELQQWVVKAQARIELDAALRSVQGAALRASAAKE